MGKRSTYVQHVFWARVLETLKDRPGFTVLDLHEIVPSVCWATLRNVLKRWREAGAVVPIGFRRVEGSSRPFTVYAVNEQQKEGE